MPPIASLLFCPSGVRDLYGTCAWRAWPSGYDNPRTNAPSRVPTSRHNLNKQCTTASTMRGGSAGISAAVTSLVSRAAATTKSSLRAVIGLLDGRTACPVDASPTPMPEDAASAAFLQMATAPPPSPPPSPPAADDRSAGRAGPQRPILRPDSPHPFAPGSPVEPIAKHHSRKALAASNAATWRARPTGYDTTRPRENFVNETQASQEPQTIQLADLTFCLTHLIQQPS